MLRSDDSRKDDIVEQLHKYLQDNASRLSSNPALEGYYGRRSSPVKRESTAAAVAEEVEDVTKSVVKGRGKKPTKIKQEMEYVYVDTHMSVTPLTAPTETPPARPSRLCNERQKQ